MSRLLTAVAILAILLLVGAFVPVKGVTLVERLTGEAASRTATRPVKGTTPARTASSGGSAPASAPPAAKPVPEPVEHHTEADRVAIDRLVSERTGKAPSR